MLSCKEAAKLVSEGLDRKLSFRRRMSLRLHVLMCRVCWRYIRQVRTLDELVSEHYRGVLSVHGPERPLGNAAERIKAALRRGEPHSDSQ